MEVWGPVTAFFVLVHLAVSCLLHPPLVFGRNWAHRCFFRVLEACNAAAFQWMVVGVEGARRSPSFPSRLLSPCCRVGWMGSSQVGTVGGCSGLKLGFTALAQQCPLVKPVPLNEQTQPPHHPGDRRERRGGCSVLQRGSYLSPGFSGRAWSSHLLSAQGPSASHLPAAHANPPSA